MKLSLKTVSALVICALGLLVTPCVAQSEATSAEKTQSATVQPPPEIQPVPKDTPTKATVSPTDNAAAPSVSAEKNPPTSVSKSSAESGSVGSQKRYIIGALDVLFIKVWNQPQLSGAVDVRPDGMLSMSLIGEIKADGLTAAQLKEAIQTRLSDFLNNPEVDVQVAKVNSKRFFVYGGVFRPGEFPLVQATTIMDALSQVGGFKDFAKPTKITIQRGAQTFHFNYKDFSKGKNMDKNVNIELENGDRIYVPE